MECKLLRSLDFKLDLEAHLPNGNYLRTYTRCIFEPSCPSHQLTSIQNMASAICNDSFYTYVNLLFPVQTVALSTVLLAAQRYKIVTPLQVSGPS